MEKEATILIVEDDPFLNRLYRDKLQRAGFTVVVAGTGEEGIRRAESDQPDLILLDILLQNKNGFDVLRDLKKNKETSAIPVVFLTNLGQETDIQKGLSLGAVDYLTKTDFSIVELPAIVRKHLGGKASSPKT